MSALPPLARPLPRLVEMTHFTFPRSIETALRSTHSLRLNIMRGEKGWAAVFTGEEQAMKAAGQGLTLENALEDLGADIEPNVPPEADEASAGGPETTSAAEVNPLEATIPDAVNGAVPGATQRALEAGLEKRESAYSDTAVSGSAASAMPLSAHAMRKVEHLFGSESTLMTVLARGPHEFTVGLTESAHAPPKSATASSVAAAFLELIGGAPDQDLGA